MSQYTDEPRFTIEQIDLLQRLRRTGMTRPEILHALDTLDRLDRQHGHKFGRRGVPHPHPHPGPSSHTNTSSASSNNVVRTSTATQTGFQGNNTNDSNNNNGLLALSSSSSSPPTTTTADYDNSVVVCSTPPPPPPPAPATPGVSAVTQNGRVVVGDGGLVAMTNGKLTPSPPRFPSVSAGGGGGGAGGQQVYGGFEPTDEELDIDDKVEELMRRDSAIIKEEIKAFLGNRRISQAVVAQVTGISQSRISHWLLQQGSDLSEQKKRAFYRWYQLEKTNPGATLTMRPAPLALEDLVEWQQTPPPISSASSAPGSFRLRRGSRFTWRKECLAVMESYFNENQYPDEAKREEIANACNAVIQKPGKKLSDLERVTSLKVYNWFANRRKEIKRRANIAILESHGMDVQSPGGHSNSDDIDGNDFPDQGCEVSMFEKRAVTRPFGFSRLDLSSPTQVPTLLPSWLAAWPGMGRGGAGGQGRQGGSSLIGRSSVSGGGGPGEGSRLTGVSWSPPSSPTQDGSPSHSALLGSEQHQDPITLAVEMAAVNHSILALATQGGGIGGDIKTEVLDDD